MTKTKSIFSLTHKETAEKVVTVSKRLFEVPYVTMLAKEFTTSTVDGEVVKTEVAKTQYALEICDLTKELMGLTSALQNHVVISREGKEFFLINANTISEDTAKEHSMKKLKVSNLNRFSNKPKYMLIIDKLELDRFENNYFQAVLLEGYECPMIKLVRITKDEAGEWVMPSEEDIAEPEELTVEVTHEGYDEVAPVEAPELTLSK